MLRLVVGSMLVLVLAGCAAHRTAAPVTGWRAWTVDPRTAQVVQDVALSPSYEACRGVIRDQIAQGVEMCRRTPVPECAGALDALQAARCSPEAAVQAVVATPAAVAPPAAVPVQSGPTVTDRVFQFLAILATARSGRSSGMVLGPIQWNAYGPGVHMDGTGRAVQLVPR